MTHPAPSVRMRCAVIGAGAWGTAIADRLGRNGHAVRLWAREADVVASVNRDHVNARFLAGASLSDNVQATSDMATALEEAVLVVFAAPSHVLRTVVRAGAAHIAPSAVLAVATKGIERDTLALMTDVVAQESPTACDRRVQRPELCR